MLIALVGLSMGLTGCSHPDRGPVVPYTDTERAQPLGIPNLRFYADGDPAPMIEKPPVRSRGRKRRCRRPANRSRGCRLRIISRYPAAATTARSAPA
jgi:hypothetical protein